MRFLGAWVSFLRSHDAKELTYALDQWSEFYADESGDDSLSGMIESEEGVDDRGAYDIVLKAQGQVGKYLLDKAFSIAAEEWRSDGHANALGIAQAALTSGMDEDWKFMSLQPVADIGDELAHEVASIADGMPGWAEIGTTALPDEVSRLEGLAQAVGNRHPAVAGWNDSVREWKTALAWRMREHAVSISNGKGEHQEALKLCVRALGLTPEPPVLDRIMEDIEDLRTIVDAKHVALSRADEANEVNLWSGIPWGCVFWGGVLAIGGVAKMCGPETGSSESGAGRSNYESPAFEGLSGGSSPVPGPEVPDAESRAQAEDARLRRLAQEYDKLDVAVAVERQRLEVLAQQMKKARLALDLQKETIDTLDVDQYDPGAVESFNSLVRRYESGRKKLNAKVDEHNRLVRVMNRKVKRLNEIVRALKAEGS